MTRWLAALALSGLALVCEAKPSPQPHANPHPHHSWFPLPEWSTSSEPLFTSWDYLGFNNPYQLTARQQAPEAWLPPPAPPAAPQIEFVRPFRKPAAQPSPWTQIPVFSGNGDKSVWVALVPRDFEDFVLIRKPFVIVEESDEPPKKERTKPKTPQAAKSDDEATPATEATSTSARTTASTMKATTPTTTTTTPSTTTTTTTSTTPSTPADMVTMDDDAQQSTSATAT